METKLKQNKEPQHNAKLPVSSRFFFFVYSFWGDKTSEGKGNISFISNNFPKKQDVITACQAQVQKNYNDKFNKVDIVIENWIEMSKDDYERFVS